MDHNELFRQAGTAGAVGGTAGVIVGWLPAIPSVVLASIFWIIRICETRTGQRWVARAKSVMGRMSARFRRQ